MEITAWFRTHERVFVGVPDDVRSGSELHSLFSMIDLRNHRRPWVKQLVLFKLLRRQVGVHSVASNITITHGRFLFVRTIRRKPVQP